MKKSLKKRVAYTYKSVFVHKNSDLEPVVKRTPKKNRVAYIFEFVFVHKNSDLELVVKKI